MKTQTVVDLLKRQRHDYGNVLQVVGAYLEMNMAEEAQQYICEKREELFSEQNLFNTADVDIALYLYLQALKANDLGFNLYYEDIAITSYELLKANNEPNTSLSNLIRNSSLTRETNIYLSLYEDELGIDLFFSCENIANKSYRTRLNKG